MRIISKYVNEYLNIKMRMTTRYNWNKPRYVKLRLDHLVMISTNGFSISYNRFKYSVSNKNFTVMVFYAFATTYWSSKLLTFYLLFTN